MSADHTYSLKVPGATLHYRVRGAGPVLLVLQGGDGDAEGSEALGELLCDRWAVLTYDRRGLTRSTLDPGAPPPDLATHAEDASRVLAAVTPSPADVLGISIGGSIGLELLARHPEQVRRFVCHEAPVTQLLPDAERGPAVRAQEEIEQLYREKGPGAAMRKFMAIAGVNLEEFEVGVKLPAPNPSRLQNIEFFLTHDAPSARVFKPDLEALKAQLSKLVLAGGANAKHAIPYRCTLALSQALGVPIAEFPGAHNGHVFQPKAFAAKLAELLAG